MYTSEQSKSFSFVTINFKYAVFQWMVLVDFTSMFFYSNVHLNNRNGIIGILKQNSKISMIHSDPVYRKSLKHLDSSKISSYFESCSSKQFIYTNIEDLYQAA